MIWLSDLKYVRVMKVEDKGKYVKATLSTSEKKQDGSREFSSWYASFVGSCAEQAKSLREKDTIEIVKGKLSNVYNKEKKQSYLNMTVFEFTSSEKKDTSGINDDFSFGNFEEVDEDNPFI